MLVPRPTAPCVDPAPIRVLSRRLAELGYGRAGSSRPGGPPATPDAWGLAAAQPAADGSPLSTCFALFWAGTPVPVAQAEPAFAPLPLAELERLGLVELRQGLAHPRCLLRPADGLLIASDTGAADTDCVLGVVPASETLARLTVRSPAERGLDLGTGCGVQGLLLARHCTSVLSVDVNPRALAFARFNAALNDLPNVECREGSWFDPVAGERFDVIACNPPYVISPDADYTYRDGGLGRDAVCRMVVREAAAHLADGGFATVLCNWIHPEDWADPLRPWVTDTGCDAMLLHYASLEPAEYAARWNAELAARAPREYDAAMRRWTDYYAAEGITRIGLGAVVLRRRDGARHWTRALDMATGPSCPSSDHLLRLFSAGDFLASDRGRNLLACAYRLVDGHRIDQTLSHAAGSYTVGPAVYRCVPGLGLEAHVDARALDVLLECDGRRRLDDLVTEAAQRRGEPATELRTLVEDSGRRLLERGFLTPVD